MPPNSGQEPCTRLRPGERRRSLYINVEDWQSRPDGFNRRQSGAPAPDLVTPIFGRCCLPFVHRCRAAPVDLILPAATDQSSKLRKITHTRGKFRTPMGRCFQTDKETQNITDGTVILTVGFDYYSAGRGYSGFDIARPPDWRQSARRSKFRQCVCRLALGTAPRYRCSPHQRQRCRVLQQQLPAMPARRTAKSSCRPLVDGQTHEYLIKTAGVFAQTANQTPIYGWGFCSDDPESQTPGGT